MRRHVVKCLVDFILVLIPYNWILHIKIIISQDGSVDFVRVWQKVQSCYDDIKKTRIEHSNNQTFTFSKPIH